VDADLANNGGDAAGAMEDVDPAERGIQAVFDEEFGLAWAIARIVKGEAD
jgi:hypothetical protein